MRIIDAYPVTALTPFGGTAAFVVEVERAPAPGPAGGEPEGALVRLELLDLGEVVSASEFDVLVPAGSTEHDVSVQVPPATTGLAAAGYQVRVMLVPTTGAQPSERLTAVLVADHWRHAPRYAFLSEFAPEDPDGAALAAQRVRHLAKHHITIVQFYDWMYRHYQLLPPADRYSDALNRELSLTTVRSRIDACHRHGMAAIAYGAVYGPEPEFILERPEWLLYDSQGDPISLIELFYITDLRAGSGWREHIL
ncbi:MAG TPA: glycoside hydrolase family 66 protein, partial [Trueperaceae bacterium]|nr:glycoside hydrolase family 66 protein [Trueperaceae bacterium]